MGALLPKEVESQVTRYQLVTLALALGVAASLIGVGIAIAEQSIVGIILCLVSSVVLMGGGFSYKKKHLR
jgi:hypothetical protein